MSHMPAWSQTLGNDIRKDIGKGFGLAAAICSLKHTVIILYSLMIK